MKIFVNTGPTRLMDLRNGTLFDYGNFTYVKIDEIDSINLTTGDIEKVSGIRLVAPYELSPSAYNRIKGE